MPRRWRSARDGSPGAPAAPAVYRCAAPRADKAAAGAAGAASSSGCRPASPLPGGSQAPHVRSFQDKRRRRRRSGQPRHRHPGQVHARPGRARIRLGQARDQERRRQQQPQPVRHQGRPRLEGQGRHAVTTEYVNGVPQTRVEKFRAYDSYADSFKDYAKLLASNPRYEKVLASARRRQQVRPRPAEGRLRHRSAVCCQAEHDHHEFARLSGVLKGCDSSYRTIKSSLSRSCRYQYDRGLKKDISWLEIFSTSARRGLFAAQAGLATTGHNISNAACRATAARR